MAELAKPCTMSTQHISPMYLSHNHAAGRWSGAHCALLALAACFRCRAEVAFFGFEQIWRLKIVSKIKLASVYKLH